MNEKSQNEKNKVIQILFIISYPLIRLYEDQLKYMNNENYYNMVIFGDDYINSGEKLVYLKKRNDSRLHKLLPTINIQKNIMRLFLSSLSGLVFYILMKTRMVKVDNYFVDPQIYVMSLDK